jgi:peptidoglycan/LPS O-acetylase OafA/YrhL
MIRSSARAVSSLMKSGMAELVDRPKGQMPALDALRSFAILLVVFHHWAIREYQAAGGIPTWVQKLPFLSYGWTGVDLFFVLSGLLIGKQLWKELDRTGSIHFGRFVLRRGLRIWPIYFAVLIYYALFSAQIRPHLADWVFLSNYFPGGFGRGWSLSTEEQFYIAIPLLLLLVRRRVPLIGYLWILLGIEAAVQVNRYLTLQSLAANGIAYQRADYIVVYPFHQHLEALLAGLVLALLSVTRPSYFAAAKSSSGISWRGLAIMVVATAGAIALRMRTEHQFAFLALGLIFGSATYFALVDRSLLTRWMHSRFWYPISRLSYSMYLNHWWLFPSSNQFILRQVQHVTTNPAAAFVISMLIGTVFSVALAAVMFIAIEHPFLVLRDRKLLPKSRSAPAPTPAPVPGADRWRIPGEVTPGVPAIPVLAVALPLERAVPSPIARERTPWHRRRRSVPTEARPSPPSDAQTRESPSP